MDFENKKVLGVHIEGEKKLVCTNNGKKVIKGFCQFIHNTPNTIIRWGKEEVEEAIINKNKRDNAKEFLY